nr:MAG TPA: hypothetical protein [Caudoviricetes sp.]
MRKLRIKRAIALTFAYPLIVMTVLVVCLMDSECIPIELMTFMFLSGIVVLTVLSYYIDYLNEKMKQLRKIERLRKRGGYIHATYSRTGRRRYFSKVNSKVFSGRIGV